MNRINRVFALLLLLATLLCVLPLSVAADGVRTDTLNLINVRQNERGTGYEWNNKTDTLTLTNFTLKTEDRYGLRLPDCGKSPATVVLVGDNVIEASYAALDVLGSADFKGDGTLTLVGGSYGWINTATLTGVRVKIQGGSYIIEGGESAVYSERATWSVVGGNVTLKSDGEAVVAREIVIQGGTVSANAPLHATRKLTASYAALNVSAKTAALVSDKELYVSGMKLTADGKATEEYAGEATLVTTPKSRARTTSMLFTVLGMENVPVVADYLCLAVAVLGIAALIVLPKLKKKKALAAAQARYAAEEAARKAAKKEAK